MTVASKGGCPPNKNQTDEVNDKGWSLVAGLRKRSQVQGRASSAILRSPNHRPATDSFGGSSYRLILVFDAGSNSGGYCEPGWVPSR